MKKACCTFLIILLLSCNGGFRTKNLNSHIDYKDGKYYGEVNSEKLPEGKGKILFSNGDKYDGDWINGEINGYGVYNYSNGNVYSGEFIDGKKNGKGKLTYNDGNYYDGNWKNDKWYLKGSYKSYTYIYEGTIKNNSITGYGKLFFIAGDLSGNKYEGNVVNGKMVGKGVYYQKNGITYIGTWVKNKKHGNMVVLWQNGNRLECEFKNDKANGYGYMYDKNGNIIAKGFYVNNVLIQNEAK